MKTPAAVTDPSSGKTTLYVGIDFDRAYGPFLIDSKNNTYVLEDSSGKQLLKEHFPVNLKFSSNRNKFLIYRAQGITKASATDPSLAAEGIGAFVADTIVPAVMVKGCAIDGTSLGTWEGTVSPYQFMTQSRSIHMERPGVIVLS